MSFLTDSGELQALLEFHCSGHWRIEQVETLRRILAEDIEAKLALARKMLALKDCQLEELRRDVKTMTEAYMAYIASEEGNEFEQVRFLRFKYRELKAEFRELQLRMEGLEK